MCQPSCAAVTHVAAASILLASISSASTSMASISSYASHRPPSLAIFTANGSALAAVVLPRLSFVLTLTCTLYHELGGLGTPQVAAAAPRRGLATFLSRGSALAIAAPLASAGSGGHASRLVDQRMGGVADHREPPHLAFSPAAHLVVAPLASAGSGSRIVTRLGSPPRPRLATSAAAPLASAGSGGHAQLTLWHGSNPPAPQQLASQLARHFGRCRFTRPSFRQLR